MFSISTQTDMDETAVTARRLWLGVMTLLTVAVLSIGAAVYHESGFLRANDVELASH